MLSMDMLKLAWSRLKPPPSMAPQAPTELQFPTTSKCLAGCKQHSSQHTDMCLGFVGSLDDFMDQSTALHQGTSLVQIHIYIIHASQIDNDIRLGNVPVDGPAVRSILSYELDTILNCPSNLDTSAACYKDGGIWLTDRSLNIFFCLNIHNRARLRCRKLTPSQGNRGKFRAVAEVDRSGSTQSRLQTLQLDFEAHDGKL